MALGGMWLTALLVPLLPVDLAQACANDVSANDTYNDSCGGGYYEYYPSECGAFDDSDFSANLMCCGCGGGMRKMEGCVNDDSTTDGDGYNCSAAGWYYYAMPSACGYYDDDDFNASKQCCGCGGGEVIPCGYSIEHCRAAADMFGLPQGDTQDDPEDPDWGFIGNWSSTGCYAHKYGRWAGYAFYGLADHGGEVLGEQDLYEMDEWKFRLPRTYGCDGAPTASPSPPVKATAPPPKEASPTPAPAPTKATNSKPKLPEVVEVSMTVKGVDYNALQASKSAMTNFKESVAEGFAESASVPQDNVEVEVSEGSVKVDATITPTTEVTASKLQSDVKWSDLQTVVVDKLKAAELGDAVTSAIEVSNIDAKVAAVKVPTPAPTPKEGSQGTKAIPGGVASGAQPVWPSFAAVTAGALLVMAEV